MRDQDASDYYWRVSEGAIALPFMNATYSPLEHRPLIGLPPEMLERVYMYCTSGRLTSPEMRRLYPAGLLYGMAGITDREIVHCAIVYALRVKLRTRVQRRHLGLEKVAIGNIDRKYN